jgi:hypothetical protein
MFLGPLFGPLPSRRDVRRFNRELRWPQAVAETVALLLNTIENMSNFNRVDRTPLPPETNCPAHFQPHTDAQAGLLAVRLRDLHHQMCRRQVSYERLV